MKKGGVPLCPYFFIYGQSGIWKWAKWNDEKRVGQSEPSGIVKQVGQGKKRLYSQKVTTKFENLIKIAPF